MVLNRIGLQQGREVPHQLQMLVRLLRVVSNRSVVADKKHLEALRVRRVQERPVHKTLLVTQLDNFLHRVLGERHRALELILLTFTQTARSDQMPVEVEDTG